MFLTHGETILNEREDRPKALLAVHHVADGGFGGDVNTLTDEELRDRFPPQNRIHQEALGFVRPNLPSLEAGVQLQLLLLVPLDEIIDVICAGVVALHRERPRFVRGMTVGRDYGAGVLRSTSMDTSLPRSSLKCQNIQPFVAL